MPQLIPKVLVSVVFIPLLIFCVWSGGWWLLGLLLAVSVVGTYEFSVLQKHSGTALNPVLPALTAAVLVATAYGAPQHGFTVLLAACFILILPVLRTSNPKKGQAAAMGMFALLWLGVQPATLFLLHADNGNTGSWMALAVLIGVWVFDTFSHFCGMLLGKHRGVFPLSPKKSLEGVLGGIAFTTLGAWLAHNYTPLNGSQVIAAWAGAVVAGQVGDLFASSLKRAANAKDSSSLIPGHGGVLDRFDSLLFAAPVAWVVLQILG